MKKKHRFLKFLIFILTCIGLMYLFNELIARLAGKRAYFKEDGESFDWNGKTIYYKKTGSGKPLVLLHDLTPASSALEWSEAEEQFAKNHTVYSVELPGCARSARGSDDYVGYYYIQFLRAFSQQVVGGSSDMIATGTSALAAAAAAAYDQDVAERLVLVNPGGYGNYSFRGRLGAVLAFVLRLPILGTFVYNLMHSKAALNRFYIDRLFFNPYRADAAQIESAYEAAHLSKSSGKYLLASFLNGDMAIDVSLALKKLDLPILLVTGRALPQQSELIRQYSAFYPGIAVAQIADAKQYPQLEEPEAFVEEVEAFLD